MKINHVAIAVENVEDAAKAYQDALDVKDIEFETVESEGVKVAILHLENANIELMEPTNDSSPIKKFLEKTFNSGDKGFKNLSFEMYFSYF